MAPRKPAQPKGRKPTATRRQPQLPARAGQPLDTGMVEEVEETAIARSNLSVYSDRPVLDGGDLFIPKIRLAQGLTAEVQNGIARPGQWLVLGGQPSDKLTFIPTGMAKRRELRDKEQRSVVCRSPDAIQGVGNPGGKCAECPLSNWQPAPSRRGQPAGKNIAPQCTFIYSYMGYVVESGKMAILELYKTGELAGRMLNTMLVQSGFGNFAVALSSQQRQNGANSFYAPVVAAANVKPEIIRKALAEAGTIN